MKKETINYLRTKATGAVGLILEYKDGSYHLEFPANRSSDPARRWFASEDVETIDGHVPIVRGPCPKCGAAKVLRCQPARNFWECARCKKDYLRRYCSTDKFKQIVKTSIRKKQARMAKSKAGPLVSST